MTVPFYRMDDNPIYSRTQLTATHFWREDEDKAAGLEGGQRFLLRQGLSYVLKVGDMFELTPEVAAYARYYTGNQGEETDLMPEYSATLSTRLLNSYRVSGWGNLDRIQHSIEPQVTYRYVASYDQDDLPYYDPYDRINDDNIITYALVNRITGRTVDADGNRAYRELLNLRLSQGYDIDEARDDDLSDPQPFSSLRAELKVNPTPATALSVDSWIPVYGDQRFSKVNASASYSASAGNSASVSYSYVRDEPVNPTNDSPGVAPTPSEYVGLDLTTAQLAPVYVNFQERYDLMESQSLESVLNLEYRKKCWSLFLTLRNRSSAGDQPNENEVMISFALSGLGRIGGFGSALP
jgi:LPS-assembly protein